MPQYDVILVGAGLANMLIGLRLRQQQPELRILIIESGQHPGGNHTWSFHGADVTPQQRDFLAPFITCRWAGYEVRFPQRQRMLDGEYLTITSSRLASLTEAIFSSHLLTGSQVTGLSHHQVTLADGRRFTAAAVIDGRGYQPEPMLQTGFQAFVGQEWALEHPHGLVRPIIMDATVDQQGGYRFVYTLPLSECVLLIEDTHYIDGAWLQPQQARQNIRQYAAAQGWQLKQLLREEQGALPVTLSGDHRAFLTQRPVPCSGLRAGVFHATTGYSLPLAVALADKIALLPSLTSSQLQPMIQQFCRDLWYQQRFFRRLNRMLFLAAPPQQRWKVMQRFYGLNPHLIARFYAGKLTLYDQLRIVSGKPPIPLLAALKAVFIPLLASK